MKAPECTNGEELTAYMYGEMLPSDAEWVEGHIADCSDCANEFAGIALARYSVYEWNREEFAHLATPVVSIDYAANRSWLDALRGMFTPAPGMAYGAVAAVFLAAFLGLAYFSTSNATSEIVSSTDVPTIIESSVPSVNNAPGPASPSASIVAVDEEVQPTGNRIKPAAAKPVRAHYSKPKRIPAPPRSVRPSPDVIEAQAPRLNDFDDADIDGLRLADLVAELESE